MLETTIPTNVSQFHNLDEGLLKLNLEQYPIEDFFSLGLLPEPLEGIAADFKYLYVFAGGHIHRFYQGSLDPLGNYPGRLIKGICRQERLYLQVEHERKWILFSLDLQDLQSGLATLYTSANPFLFSVGGSDQRVLWIGQGNSLSKIKLSTNTLVQTLNFPQAIEALVAKKEFLFLVDDAGNLQYLQEGGGQLKPLTHVEEGKDLSNWSMVVELEMVDLSFQNPFPHGAVYLFGRFPQGEFRVLQVNKSDVGNQEKAYFSQYQSSQLTLFSMALGYQGKLNFLSKGQLSPAPAALTIDPIAAFPIWLEGKTIVPLAQPSFQILREGSEPSPVFNFMDPGKSSSSGSRAILFYREGDSNTPLCGDPQFFVTYVGPFVKSESIHLACSKHSHPTGLIVKLRRDGGGLVLIIELEIDPERYA